MRLLIFVIFAILVSFHAVAEQKIWQGLVVADEYLCEGQPYEREKHYRHSQAREPEIIAAMDGQIYGPYTGRTFKDRSETDIEHIVATSEAHYSGLCLQDVSVRQAFANDLENLTLAAPKIQRCWSEKAKCSKDAGEWLPPKNRCWFANKVVLVRQKYQLTIDRREADVLEGILSKCKSTEMIYF